MNSRTKYVLNMLAVIAGTIAAAWVIGNKSIDAMPQGEKPTIIAGISSNGATAIAVDQNGVPATNPVVNSLSYEPGAYKQIGGTTAPLWTSESSEPILITGTTATAVRNSEGQLKSIIVGTPAAGTVSVFDLASASCTGTPSTNTIAVVTVTTSTPPQAIRFDAHMHNGICVQASVAMNLTVTHQ